MKINALTVTTWIIPGLVAIGLSGSAFAKASFDTEYQTAKQKCDALTGNAKDICLVEAKGALSVAQAEAEASSKGTDAARLKADQARVEADYQLAQQHCEALSSHQKEVCRAEAKAAKVKGDAAAQLSSKKREATSELMNVKNKAHQGAGQLGGAQP